ncbi:MAG: FecR family protein [Endomicrobia bacterium]|nr:FecR family protein [Endomicrobiia bacterium]MCX7715818.1 FecR family protein [Endomicrobiia bacterium]
MKNYLWIVFTILNLTLQWLYCNISPVAVVVKLKGKAVVIRDKKEVKMQQYMPLYIRDIIKTFSASYVEVIFDTGVSLRIEENTVVDIKKIFLELAEEKKRQVSIVLSVNSGSLLTETTVFGDKYHMKHLYILTPTTVASVRGTVFYIKISDDKSTTVAVFKGKVEGYVSGIDEDEIEELLRYEDEEIEYEKRKKITIEENKQALFSSDWPSPAVVELSFSMKEYKRTVVEDFIKTTAEYRKNFEKFKQQRDEWIKKHKEEFKQEIKDMKKKFIEDFEQENLFQKKRR